MPNISTTTSYQPQTSLQLKGRKRLSDADWSDLSTSLMIGVQAALADREPLERNLKEWNELYEMIVDETDWPWVNAANNFIPLIPTQLESLVAYISGQVLVPRLFLVSGNTEIAAQYAYYVERYYNAELKRQRGNTTWFEEICAWLHASTRDGTAYIEALWKYSNKKSKIYNFQPQMEQNEDGTMSPVIGDDGSPVMERIEQDVEDIYNDVDLKCVELRNVLTIPAAATSIEEAVAVVKVEYLYEDQLMELVRDGVLDEKEVEAALNFVPVGETELVSSQQPTETYSAGGQLGLGIGQGTQSSKFFKNRGPIEVYRVHSRQYDLDHDGTPEENVFWVHSTSWRMLGWMRYEYFNGLRPFFAFSPFPRPKRLIGFSLVERLAGLQNEENALRNARLNAGDIRLTPPLVFKKGAFDDDEEMAWGLGQAWETDEDPTKAVTAITLPQLDPIHMQEEMLIKSDAQQYTGLSNPMIGGQAQGRQSATAARQWQAAAQTRTGLLSMRFRLAIRPLINFVHSLKKQYLTTDQNFTINGQQFKLPLQVLNQDYQIDIAGASDPVDAATRRTDTLGAVQLLMNFPLIAQNPMHQYNLLRKLLEALDWGLEADKIIGTEKDIMQQMRQQVQGQGQPGQPGQPGQNPQGQAGNQGQASNPAQ